MRKSTSRIAATIILYFCSGALAQPAPTSKPTNYDESAIPAYTLPDILDGAKDKDGWLNKRRPEIVRLFEENQFGTRPEAPAAMTCETWDTDRAALGGKAIRKQITVSFAGTRDGPQMDIAMFLPQDAGTRAVPLFLCLTFTGVHQVHKDPKLKMKEQWNRNTKSKVMPTEDTRGKSAATWPIEKAIERGYGMAFICYNDIEPDFEGGMKLGVRPLFYRPGQTEPGAAEWGSIAAWGWGLSRALDVLEKDPDVDAKRVAIVGQSRLGKTVLWAGARDTRFAMVIASCSGEGGAALSRREYGETVNDLTTKFPWQFCANYKKYGQHVDEMPVDSHMEIALIAPRPLLLNTGSEDRWSDPKGEFLAAVEAGKVYALLGKKGLGVKEMPPLDQPILHDLGFQCHTGKHDILPTDWPVFLDFADMHLKK